MAYERVIPRDLFNESSLLKCYGRVYLELEGHPTSKFQAESVASFDVVQRSSDGFLFVENLPLHVGELQYRLVRPLNARGAWPLYAELIGDPDFDAVEVFNAAGDFTPEMNVLTERAIG